MYRFAGVWPYAGPDVTEGSRTYLARVRVVEPDWELTDDGRAGSNGSAVGGGPIGGLFVTGGAAVAEATGMNGETTGGGPLWNGLVFQEG